MIDSHLHLWDLANPPGWLTADLAPIHRTFTAEDARQMHAQAGYTEAVLVQVDDTRADTEHMLDIAAAHPWVLGVVGWVDLTDPASVHHDLQTWGTTSAGTGAIAGIRHLIHEDPRSDFLDLPPVRESLSILAAAGVPLDIPDAFPRHLRQAGDLADDMPALTIVIDHLGKPPASRGEEFEAWRDEFTGAAARPNMFAKVSGLHHGGRILPRELATEAFGLAVEHFTPRRLMVGSDWPMPLLADGIEPHTELLEALLGQLSASDRDLLQRRVAKHVYGLRSAG